MDIESIFFAGFFNPFEVEPVIRGFGVTVEPHSGIADRTSCKSLFNERAWHKSDFIKENAAESHTLNKGSGGFIFAAEKVIAVGNAAELNVYVISADFFQTGETEMTEDI